MKKRNGLLYYFLIFFLCLPALKALFHPGFFPSHDGEWMVIRLSDFHRSLVSGQFPVRWAGRLNHQFGYPVFNFLYPLAFYLSEFFHLMGFDFVTAIKIVFGLSFILSGWLIFLWLKEKWGPPTGGLAGLMAALVYLYTPYRLIDVYVRGSLGEALAFVFPPLLFWMVDRLAKKFNYRDLVFAGLSLAGLITAHNTMALLFLILLVAYLFYLFFKQKRSFPIIRFSFFVITLGLGLSAFFWLPALWDKQFVIFEKMPISNFFAHFPSLRQLLVPSWGYGPSLPLSNQDAMSFQVGVFNLMIALASLLYWPKSFFVVSFWLVFFLMTPFSALIWRRLLFYNLVQFPWRLLALTTFCSAVLAGDLVTRFRRQQQIVLVSVVIFFLLFQARTYAKPEYFIERPQEFYTTNEDSTTVAAEYTPRWVRQLPSSRANQKVEIISGKGEINNLNMNSKKIFFNLTLTQPSRLRVNTHYFPGWTLLIDGQREMINYQDSGLIEFDLAAGERNVQLIFQETPLRLTADIISLLSFFVAAIFFLKKNHEKEKMVNC